MNERFLRGYLPKSILNLFGSPDKKEEYFKSYYREGVKFLEKEKYERSLEYFLKAYHSIAKGNISNKIAVLYDKIGDFENSIKYFQIAKIVATKNGNHKAYEISMNNLEKVKKKMKKSQFYNNVLNSLVDPQIKKYKLKYFTTFVLNPSLRLLIVDFCDVVIEISSNKRVEEKGESEKNGNHNTSYVKRFFGYFLFDKKKHYLVFKRVKLRGTFKNVSFERFLPTGIESLCFDSHFRNCDFGSINTANSIKSLCFEKNPYLKEKELIIILSQLRNLETIKFNFPNPKISEDVIGCLKEVKSFYSSTISPNALSLLLNRLSDCKVLDVEFEIFDDVTCFKHCSLLNKLNVLRLEGFLEISSFDFLFQCYNLKSFESGKEISINMFQKIIQHSKIKKLKANINSESEILIHYEYDNYYLNRLEIREESTISHKFYSLIQEKCKMLENLDISHETISNKDMMEDIVCMSHLKELKIKSNKYLYKIAENSNIQTLWVIFTERMIELKDIIKNVRYLTIERPRFSGEIMFSSKDFRDNQLISLSFVNFHFSSEKKFLDFLKKNTSIVSISYRKYIWTRDLK